MSKPKTVEEFLAQGGTIKKLPCGPAPETNVIKSTTSKPASLYAMSASCADMSMISGKSLADLEKALVNATEEQKQRIMGYADADLGFRSPDYGTAALHLGEPSTRKKKERVITYEGINMGHIPDELKKLLGL